MPRQFLVATRTEEMARLSECATLLAIVRFLCTQRALRPTAALHLASRAVRGIRAGNTLCIMYQTAVGATAFFYVRAVIPANA